MCFQLEIGITICGIWGESAKFTIVWFLHSETMTSHDLPIITNHYNTVPKFLYQNFPYMYMNRTTEELM